MKRPWPDSRVAALRAALRAHGPMRVEVAPDIRRAAVALVVRPDATSLELLLIKRAPRPGDPWSGHIALPGGKQDPLDPDLRFTAMRETLEEVGINLESVGSDLGALDEVQPLGSGVPPLAVSPFVFAVPAGTRTEINVEVEATFWVPMAVLADPAVRVTYAHDLGGGRTMGFPALRHRGQTVWGLTYRILSQFLMVAGPQAWSGR